MAKKQYGWMVRDPKGKIVSDGSAVVFTNKADAIYRIWWSFDINESYTIWWRKARREGYTVERVELC